MMLLPWGSFSPFSRRHDPKNGFCAVDVSFFRAFEILFLLAQFPDGPVAMISEVGF